MFAIKPPIHPQLPDHAKSAKLPQKCVKLPHCRPATQFLAHAVPCRREPLLDRPPWHNLCPSPVPSPLPSDGRGEGQGEVRVHGKGVVSVLLSVTIWRLHPVTGKRPSSPCLIRVHPCSSVVPITSFWLSRGWPSTGDSELLIFRVAERPLFAWLAPEF